MIRLIKKSDFEEIYKLEEDIFKEFYCEDPSSETIYNCCLNGHGIVYTEEKIKAYLLFCLNEKDVYVCTLGVDLNSRGKGLAKLMLNKLFQYFTKVSLHVCVDNIAAINLYLSFNFKIKEYIKTKYDSKDAYLMQKD